MSRQEEINKFVTSRIYEILEYQRGVYGITVESAPGNKNTITDKYNPVYRATITSNGCSMDIEIKSRPIALQIKELSHREYETILIPLWKAYWDNAINECEDLLVEEFDTLVV